MHEATRAEKRSPHRHRRDEYPRLLIEFIDTASQQAFLSELITELKTPSTDRKPAWRHVMKWNCGEGVQ
jgi:hypothetical protein